MLLVEAKELNYARLGSLSLASPSTGPFTCSHTLRLHILRAPLATRYCTRIWLEVCLALDRSTHFFLFAAWDRPSHRQKALQLVVATRGPHFMSCA